mmetsp:Transcript_29452/g.61345  ORF Transcript_29452/g.61345 Transcript_29452/m.61345 type:complete len:214 (-) Transcript_29452:130-771(-)
MIGGILPSSRCQMVKSTSMTNLMATLTVTTTTTIVKKLMVAMYRRTCRYVHCILRIPPVHLNPRCIIHLTTLSRASMPISMPILLRRQLLLLLFRLRRKLVKEEVQLRGQGKPRNGENERPQQSSRLGMLDYLLGMHVVPNGETMAKNQIVLPMDPKQLAVYSNQMMNPSTMIMLKNHLKMFQQQQQSLKMSLIVQYPVGSLAVIRAGSKSLR